ncbi:LuxR family two component transcriptional regulator [Haloactinospora alba]|uniref:LuxR family two component transcriptional regulator n=1 Tax=Haloactinospora alba TaxID=405555 RepID=A0A543NI85_9ACTN|nr:response regulator transcription factor [Haloactinospora alba]TQN31549.1 LuxR family two component transcriptional regulator [Haloactinospora alba]
MIRVLLADDERLIRAGIGSILSSDPAIEVAAEADSGREAVDRAREYQPDVALVDIRMPDTDGLTAIPGITGASPATAVAMLTTFGRDEYVTRALDEGANGFLLKTAAPHELVSGVHAIAAGGAFLSPEITRRVITHVRNRRVSPDEDRLAVLSARERDVLALVGDGRSNAEIARKLYVSEETVKSHVSAILARLDLANRVQAAILAHEAGIATE